MRKVHRQFNALSHSRSKERSRGASGSPRLLTQFLLALPNQVRVSGRSDVFNNQLQQLVAGAAQVGAQDVTGAAQLGAQEVTAGAPQLGAQEVVPQPLPQNEGRQSLNLGMQSFGIRMR